MTKSGQLWGGRFTEKPDKTFAEFNDSFRFDRRLFVADLRASIAHANGLAGAGVITGDEAAAITGGLVEMLAAADSNDAIFDGSDAEDVHSFIEGKLIAAIGDAGRKLHTGRSRNDQVATAFRLWLRDEIDAIADLVRDTQTSIVELAARHADAVMPGYTHLQRAQPVMFAHWCLAYFEMLKRDRDRLADARKRVNILPLGSGALAGAGFPVDREAVARELGFEGISANSLDAVSDRDFAVEFTSACSLIMVHLSRLAEDLIIYCSNEFGFVSLSDAVSSGSSLMPQKKNPDALELLRGKAGRVFGHQMGLLSMIKGLPLAYNKDMQEDKEAVFDTVDTINISLRAAAIVLDNTTLNEERARNAAAKGYLNATELADYLVKKGVPFRSAHEAVGRAVLFAIGEGKELHELSLDEIRQFSAVIGDDVNEALGLESALAAKGTIGGTSPGRVALALESARQYIVK
ncbi:MAG TPA: argininosuccinate lyase [Pyrinomonadaceae bacterium]|nr:argininosuccinate lyase [Chloracidobacterium sp.]MBL0241775.1 argininosuccinate lyase [Chloracidobacterium sp.]MBP9934339.1 argininosuccinate lyase [Pyrinomonadaceae bacterium]HQX55459.1 argininosuccinate lyase [Pyrinomonadaceae bacterium]HQY65847.1 argininosuccinate lyase [Pyrinomonadaceae bacterium]